MTQGAGLLLTPPRLGQQQEAQAWATAQIHHNLSWRQRGCGGAQFSMSPREVLKSSTPLGVTQGMAFLSLLQQTLQKPACREKERRVSPMILGGSQPSPPAFP